MNTSRSWTGNLFTVGNYAFLILISLCCLFPIIHVLSVSLSSSTAASTGMVSVWPVDITFASYKYILQKTEFLRSFGVALQRVALGFTLNMVLTILCAYPLSKERKNFKYRTVYAWYFVFTILFSGGLIPWFITINETGLVDTVWALVIPGAVPVFNVILMLNFFRELPAEIEESAFMDGAGYFTTLIRIIIPLSMPVMATVSLFTLVGHWNAWFDGLILMNFPENYPLSTYLQLMIINSNPLTLSGQSLTELVEISQRTTRAAQIFVGALPILLVYPFLQKFFVKGIVLGSVKA